MSALATVSAFNSPLTMSSREIAELTAKDHRNVLRDARKMLTELHGEDRLLSFESTVDRPNPSGGAPIRSPVLLLPKRETLILISGYSVTLRARIIDRWQQLEDQARDPAANLTRLQILQIAIDSEEKRIELEKKVKEMQPKADAHDHLMHADGAVIMLHAAKALEIHPSDLTYYMRTHRWIYKRRKFSYDPWLAYQDKLDEGLLTNKVATYSVDGGRTMSYVVRVTAKGLATLGLLLTPDVRRMLASA